MKKNYKKTKKPSKQRKRLYQAPLHQRRKMMTAPLAPALQEKYGVKSLVVRKGDSVRLTKGSFKGIEGEVSKVDYKKMRLTVEGITFEKTDGSAQNFPVRACNCELIDLKNMKDKKRQAILDRKKTAVAEEEEDEK